MIEVLGIAAGVLFSISGIPMTLRVIRVGEAIGIPLLTILCVLFGAIFMTSYLLSKTGFDIIIMLDYGLTIISWSVILFYKIFPRKKV